MGVPETGGADSYQVAQETWRIQANLTTPPSLNIRYPGQYYDFEAGLVQNWWRTYEPRIGRYVSADPIGLDGGWNRFAYADGDGINGFDPDGLRRTANGYYTPFRPRPRVPRPRLPRASAEYESNAEAAAEFFDDEGRNYCVRWHCPKSENSCSKTDIKSSTDFLPAASDPFNPPKGCVCDSARWRNNLKKIETTLDPIDILEKITDIHIGLKKKVAR